jgi:4-hydroxy-4-methyl-2-oxoglutarate aldolase
VPTELIEALSKIDSPTVANAIEFFEVRDPTTGFASMELKCQYPDLKPMVGYAVTCTVDSTTPLPRGNNVRYAVFEAIQVAPKPVAVVLQDIGPQRLRSCHAGDVLSTTFQNLGAVGLVTDGGVRDIDGIAERAPGFQVFAPGTVVAHGVPRFVEIGVTVNICGMTIQPGDLLHGDANGLLVVPAEIADKIANQAHQVWERESKIVNYVKSDDFTLEGLKEIESHGA